jgi:hypothetical protein
MLDPVVSWVICLNNLNQYARFAIDSCLVQTFKDLECVIVANGPNARQIGDEIGKWYQKDPRVRVVITDLQFLTFSLSLGVSSARGRYIARMDIDDESTPDRLEKQVAFMEKHGEVAVLGTSYDLIDDNGFKVSSVVLPLTNESIRRWIYFINPICHPSVIIRRDALLEMGGYLGGTVGQDYDLWARMIAQKKFRFANLAETCLHYRMNSTGIARRSKTAYAIMATAQFRNFIQGFGIMWAAASFLSLLKILIRSRQS